jgi:hypothetical protein
MDLRWLGVRVDGRFNFFLGVVGDDVDGFWDGEAGELVFKRDEVVARA